jgi:uncharacterized membrane protein YqjE
MGEPDPKADGLTAAVRRMGDSILALAQSRFQLIALEFQGEKLRFVGFLLWYSLGAALSAVGLLLGTMALGIFLWNTAGYSGLLITMGIFMGAAAFVFWRLRERIRHAPTPFADTIAEFNKDRACLRNRD